MLASRRSPILFFFFGLLPPIDMFMKKFSPVALSSIIGLTALLASCGPKEESPVDQGGALSSTADLAREARFSPWTSKAGLQFKMEQLPRDEYFAMVEGRLKDGANQYRAISEKFDREIYRDFAVVWGLGEEELFGHELSHLRVGFHRHHSQVFTDSSGVALHQLTMLRRVGEVGSLPAPISTSSTSALSPEVIVAAAEEQEVPPVDFIQPELRKIDEPEIYRGKVPAVTPASGAAKATEAAGSAGEEKQGALEISDESLPGVKEGVQATEAVAANPESVADVKLALKADPETKSETKSEAKSEAKPKRKPAPKVLRYRVVSGDTLSGIARRHGVSVRSLKKANGLRSDVIRLRQVLKIPKA